MKIQNYRDGEIHKNNGKYIFIKGKKVIGTYQSIEELVLHNNGIKMIKKLSKNPIKDNQNV